jgi:hypothetical protein
MVTDKLEVQAVMVNRDSKAGGTFRQIEHLPERLLSKFVAAATETQ